MTDENIDENKDHDQSIMDELLLIDQRAEERVQELSELLKNVKDDGEKLTSEFMAKIDSASEVFEKISRVSEQADLVVKNCSDHVGRMFSTFLGTLVACLLIIGGTIFWSYQTQNKLQKVKLELEQANTHLQGKPLFLVSNGKNYVRIVSGTESYPKDDKKYHGEYAEIWSEGTN